MCHTCHGWGIIVMGKNVISVHEGSFLTVNMDRCKDITGGHFSMLHWVYYKKVYTYITIY